MIKLQLLIKKFWENNKALGLVEALVALAVVGTGMVVITSLAIKTMKKARENEMQDVAVQAAVEAMDLAKMPGTLPIHSQSVTNPANLNHFLRLEDPDIYGIHVVATPGEQEISETDHPTTYLSDNLSEEGFEVYQQIHITSVGSSTQKFNLKVIVVWESVGGEYRKIVLEGYRYGPIEIGG